MTRCKANFILCQVKLTYSYTTGIHSKTYIEGVSALQISFEELQNYANLPPENKARFLEIKTAEEHEIDIEKRKKNSPFNNWLQVNNADEFYKAESWLIRKSPVAYQVLRFLAKEMDNYNAIICSFKVMEETLGYSRQTLSAAVAFLKKHKFIDVKKSGVTNVYLINKELYWKSWGTNHRYAEFGAKIILSASEQDAQTQAEIQLQLKKRQEVILKTKKSA